MLYKKYVVSAGNLDFVPNNERQQKRGVRKAIVDFT